MMMTPIKVIAPGKVILHGEHAVVHGTKAIAVSVGLYTTINICPAGINGNFDIKDIKKLKISVGEDFTYGKLIVNDTIPMDVSVVRKIDQFIDNHDILGECPSELMPAQKAALEAIIFLYLAIFDSTLPLKIKIETELPVGAGLGSSASFGVALVGGLLLAAGRLDAQNVDMDLVNRWAYVSEKFVHGNPSGIDNSIVTFGGAVVFQKGQPLQQDKCKDIRVLLVNTAVSRSTKDLVSKVQSLKENGPPLFQTLIDGIKGIVEESVNNIKTVGTTTVELIRKNQEILRQLNVSHNSLNDIVETANSHGFSAKLTGAGGGGCAFVFIPSDYNEVNLGNLKTELKKKYQLWDTVLGCKGFQIA